MPPITASAVLRYSVKVCVNTMLLFFSFAAIVNFTYIIVNCVDQTLGSTTSVEGRKGSPKQPLEIDKDTAAGVAFVLHLTLTFWLAVTSYWTTMRFRLCILASATGISAVEIAFLIVRLVIKVVHNVADTATAGAPRRLSAW